eukprot:177557-Chlamydomonas_euryale.AAC.7
MTIPWGARVCEPVHPCKSTYANACGREHVRACKGKGAKPNTLMQVHDGAARDFAHGYLSGTTCGTAAAHVHVLCGAFVAAVASAACPPAAPGAAADVAMHVS